MSEKRFVVKELNFEDTVIEDTVTKEQYNEYGVVDLLNEQQATITAQKKGLNEYMDNIIALSKENEQLRQLLEEYRKTNKHLSELCANASKNGYLPPLENLQ